MAITKKLFLWLTIILISGCRDYVSKKSLTNASLQRINEIFLNCKESGVNDLERCLIMYAENNNIDYRGLIVDGYGNNFFLKKDEVFCEKYSLSLPYSAGQNGLDDCGQSDDMVLSRSQK